MLLLREVNELEARRRSDVLAIRVGESCFVLEREVNGRFEPVPVQWIGPDNDGSIGPKGGR
jgi:hypothetical protein